MNHTLHRALCTLLLLILAWHLHAKPIEGTVSDAAGNPIIGATIVEVSTSNGTVTDIDGLFFLDVEDGKKIFTIALPKNMELEVKLPKDADLQLVRY